MSGFSARPRAERRDTGILASVQPAMRAANRVECRDLVLGRTAFEGRVQRVDDPFELRPLLAGRILRQGLVVIGFDESAVPHRRRAGGLRRCRARPTGAHARRGPAAS